MAQSTSRQSGTDFISRATDAVNQATEQIGDAASRAAEHGREARDAVQKVAGNFKGVVDKSLKDQPMATLGVAAVAGFVLGALWKS